MAARWAGLPARARAALAYVALFTAIGAQAPYLVLYYQSLGFDLARIGGIASVAALVGLLAAPGWGSVSDRYAGSPWVLVAATVTAISGTALLWQARGPLPVVAAAMLLAAGMAGLSPILDARALETAGGDRAGYGPLRAWGSASYIASAFGTGAAIEAWGIGAAIVVLGGALAATGLVGLSLRPAIVQAAGRPLIEAGRMLGPRGLGVFLVGALLTWTATSAVMGFYSLRFTELGAPATMIGLASALGAAVEVPIMLRFPSLVGRFGAQRLLIAGAAIFAARALVAALTTDPAILVVASGVGGIGFALFLVGSVTFVSRNVPARLAATAQGIFQGVSVSLSQVAGAALGGAIASSIGLAGLYLLAAALAAVATVVVALGASARPAFEAQPSIAA